MKKIIFEKILGHSERKFGYVNLTKKYCEGDFILPDENTSVTVIIDGNEYKAKVYHNQLWSGELKKPFAKIKDSVVAKITYYPKDENNRLEVMIIEFDNDIHIITDEVEDDNITLIKEETLEYDNHLLDSQEEKYKCIFTLVNCIKNEYEKMSDKQKAFVETVIGASIYYTKNHYAGKSSVKAIELGKKIKLGRKTKLTPDHIIPRKFAAKELLSGNFSEKETTRLIKEEYAKIYYVIKEENGKMRKHQKSDFFDPQKIDSYYEQEGIILEEITEEKLLGKKKK